jgi:hypothetical protein
VLQLPSASTISGISTTGKVLYITDRFGMAAANPLIITPRLNERIDTSSIATALTQNNQTIALAASGGSNWMVLESDVPPPPFSPDQIPGLGLWLDASDTSKVILSTTTTSTIGVRSKGITQLGNLIQTCNIRYPQISTSFINGYSALAFTSSFTVSGSTGLSNNVLPHNSTGFSIFAVGYLKTPAVQGTSFIHTLVNGTIDQNGYLFFGAVNCNFSLGIGDRFTISPLPTTAVTPNCNLQTLSLMQASLEVNTLYPAVNSKQLNTIFSTVAQTSFSGIQIGCRFSDGWNGYLGELLYYNYKLPPKLEQRVQSYLTYKWGIPTTTLATGGNAFINGPTPFTPFDPNSVGNCMLWLDASDKTTLFQDTGLSIPVLKSGDLVLGWKDKSVNRNHARAIGVTRGIHYTSKETTSCDSVYFTGNQENGFVLSNSLLPPGDTTYFFVLRYYNNNSSYASYYFQHGPPAPAYTRQFYQCNAGFNLTNTFSPTLVLGIYPQDIQKFNIISITYSASFTTYGYDVTPGPAANLSPPVFSSPINGSLTPTGNANLGCNVIAGSIAEILVYSNILYDSARQQVEGYLAWKYNNLWQNLSNGHISRAVPTYSNSFSSNIWVSATHSATDGGTFVSYNNGLSWIRSSNGFGQNGPDTPYGLATNGSMWVAVGAQVNGCNIRYSYNGINWSNAVSGGFATNVTGRDIAYNGTNLWVAVGDYNSATGSNACIKYSGDGLNWSNSITTTTLFNTAGTTFPMCVKYGGSPGIWLVGCTGLGSANLLRSTDGSNWTTISTTIDARILDFAYSSGLNRWVAVGVTILNNNTNFSNVQVSIDNGLTWRGIASLNAPNTLTIGTRVAASPTMFIYVTDRNSEPNCMRYSLDGSNWTAILGVHLGLGFDSTPYGRIVYNGSRWIAAGDRQQPPDTPSPGLWWSDNGFNWSASLSGYSSRQCGGLAFART